MKLWLEDWEWQCCGDRFTVGSEVAWDLVPADEELRSYLATFLPTDLVDEITHYETHHADDAQEKLAPTRGRVEAIDAVYVRLAPRADGDPRVYYPVGGTTVLEGRETADGWEPEADGGPSFGGYIVEFAPLG